MSAHYYMQPYSFEEVNNLVRLGYAVDGTGGGLVMGRSHDEGGIFMLINFKDEYRLTGEMEGFEYVLNVATSYLCRNRLKEWNNSERDEEEPFLDYAPTSGIKIIDTTLPPGSLYPAKFILFEGRGHQHIYNKHSSKKYLELLNEVNMGYRAEHDNTTNTFTIFEEGTNTYVDRVHLIYTE